jgi:uncharacterized membrane protein YeiH
VDTSSPLFLVLDPTGVFAFALNGALTATRVARLDIVGVLSWACSRRWVAAWSATSC